MYIYSHTSSCWGWRYVCTLYYAVFCAVGAYHCFPSFGSTIPSLPICMGSLVRTGSAKHHNITTNGGCFCELGHYFPKQARCYMFYVKHLIPNLSFCLCTNIAWNLAVRACAMTSACIPNGCNLKNNVPKTQTGIFDSALVCGSCVTLFQGFAFHFKNRNTDTKVFFL